MLWTVHLQDLPNRLPEKANATSFEGLCEIQRKGKKDESAMKAKKSLAMRIGVPVKRDGVMPKEIDSFLESLRENKQLKKDFPIVGARQNQVVPAVRASDPPRVFHRAVPPQDNRPRRPSRRKDGIER